MSSYQPFFVAFANSRGVSPAEASSVYGGVDFVPRIGRQWRDYFTSNDRPADSRPSEDDFPRFTTWLTAKYPTPATPISAVENCSVGDSPEGPAPDLLAVIRRGSTGREIVVVRTAERDTRRDVFPARSDRDPNDEVPDGK